MFKLKLNKKHVAYVQKIKNKNLLKLFVVIMCVYNVINNSLKIINGENVHNVEDIIGLLQQMKNIIKNLSNIIKDTE